MKLFFWLQINIDQQEKYASQIHTVQNLWNCTDKFSQKDLLSLLILWSHQKSWNKLKVIWISKESFHNQQYYIHTLIVTYIQKLNKLASMFPNKSISLQVFQLFFSVVINSTALDIEFINTVERLRKSLQIRPFTVLRVVAFEGINATFPQD